MKTVEGDAVALRIYIGESDHFQHKPLHEALIEAFRTAGLAGATVTRANAGYGAHALIHTEKIMRLSIDLPVVIEVIDDADKIREAITIAERMMDGGMMTTSPVHVIRTKKMSNDQ